MWKTVDKERDRRTVSQVSEEAVSWPVLSKRDFVRRYQKGEFGNAGPSWNSVEEFSLGQPKRGRYHLRCRKVSGPTHYDLDEEALQRTYRVLLSSGWKSEDWYVSEMAPTEKTRLQGEVQQTPDGLYLYFSTLKETMRSALHMGGREARGVVAENLLKSYLPPEDYDWLQVLLDRYPGHVIEFSTYSVPYGTISGCKTVWWEVRLY